MGQKIKSTKTKKKKKPKRKLEVSMSQIQEVDDDALERTVALAKKVVKKKNTANIVIEKQLEEVKNDRNTVYGIKKESLVDAVD